MNPPAIGPLALPEGWGLTQLMLHREDPGLATATRPFAATIMVQLRLDARPGAELSAVREADLQSLRRNLPSMELVATDEVQVGGQTLSAIEWLFPDPEIGTLRQMVLYIEQGSRIYTLTGTQRSESFEEVRQELAKLALSMAAAPREED